MSRRCDGFGPDRRRLGSGRRRTVVATTLMGRRPPAGQPADLEGVREVGLHRRRTGVFELHRPELAAVLMLLHGEMDGDHK
jgi:hypothetical protein